MRKKVVLLGSTGSVGRNACKVLEFHKDKFEVRAIAANTNYKTLIHQSERLGAAKTIIVHEEFFEHAKSAASGKVSMQYGSSAMIDAVCDPGVDIVLCAILGTGALEPVLKALQCGKIVALASKEVMLTAGKLVMDTMHRFGGRIIPVDSEHSAIFQCLAAHKKEDVKSLVLTCSGGPFRTFSAAQLAEVTKEDALKHPVWSMGRKITVDSASLMNKALEVVEAAYLFETEADKIQTVIHPEGIIHSLAEFRDNSMVGLFSNPSMELPIQYALTYPDVVPSEVAPLNLAELGSLHFERIDSSVFPSIEIARHALKIGKNMPLVMNAANDVAVKNFLEGKLKFTQIWDVVNKTMEKTAVAELNELADINMADEAARAKASEIVKKLGCVIKDD